MVGPSCVSVVFLTVFEGEKFEFHYQKARKLVFGGLFFLTFYTYFAVVGAKCSLSEQKMGAFSVQTGLWTNNESCGCVLEVSRAVFEVNKSEFH